jgi:hypothetical protein
MTRLAPNRMADLRRFVEWQRDRPDLIDGTNVAAALLDELDAMTRERNHIVDLRDNAEIIAHALNAILTGKVFARGPDDWRVKCQGGELHNDRPDPLISLITLDSRDLREAITAVLESSDSAASNENRESEADDEGRPYPCGCFVTGTGEQCTLESDHDGPHCFASDEAPDMRKLGFQLARTAHWMVNDRGYTKRMASSDLREIARQLLTPEEFAQTIGDAGRV